MRPGAAGGGREGSEASAAPRGRGDRERPLGDEITFPARWQALQRRSHMTLDEPAATLSDAAQAIVKRLERVDVASLDEETQKILAPYDPQTLYYASKDRSEMKTLTESGCAIVRRGRGDRQSILSTQPGAVETSSKKPTIAEAIAFLQQTQKEIAALPVPTNPVTERLATLQAELAALAPTHPRFQAILIEMVKLNKQHAPSHAPIAEYVEKIKATRPAFAALLARIAL